MKKLFCILLIVALLLPSAVFADDPDPIVGCWYMYYDKSVAPEMESAFENADIAVSFYFFNDSGVIYALNAQIVGKDGTSAYVPSGKWSKADYGYNIGLIGYGESSGFIENDSLLYEIPNAPNYYIKLKHLYSFDPYKDYVRK